MATRWEIAFGRGGWRRFELRKPAGATSTIAVTGDALMGYPAGREVRIDPALIDALAGFDVLIVNQEGPLTRAPAAKPVGALSAPPSAARHLVALGVDVANLANNHIMDCGPEGLTETIRVLEDAGIKAIGAGLDRARAAQPLVIDLRECELILLAFADRQVPPVASADRPGPMPLRPGDASEVLASLRRPGRVVCAMYHGGEEFLRVPMPSRRQLLKSLAAAGAQIVVSHHAHLFQGIETSASQVVAYGLGNFHLNLPAYPGYAGTEVGMVLGVELDAQGPCSVSTLFVRMCREENRVSLLPAPAAEKAAQLLTSLSDILRCQRQYASAWRQACLRAFLGKGRRPVDLTAGAIRRAALRARVAGFIMKMALCRTLERDILTAAARGMIDWCLGARGEAIHETLRRLESWKGFDE
jgi:poly-gamma-glutamate synthesis protein (capsule biosynthesis protein)